MDDIYCKACGCAIDDGDEITIYNEDIYCSESCVHANVDNNCRVDTMSSDYRL